MIAATPSQVNDKGGDDAEQWVICRGCDAVISSTKATYLWQKRAGFPWLQVKVCRRCGAVLPAQVIPRPKVPPKIQWRHAVPQQSQQQQSQQQKQQRTTQGVK